MSILRKELKIENTFEEILDNSMDQSSGDEETKEEKEEEEKKKKEEDSLHNKVQAEQDEIEKKRITIPLASDAPVISGNP